MIAIPQQPQKMTIEEYLEWEPHQDDRIEFEFPIELLYEAVVLETEE
jgi:Uma2 family endonuclease